MAGQQAPETRVITKSVVIDAEGNCLLLYRSGTHPTHPHKPDLPGGLAEEGESLAQAAARELREETGLFVRPSDAAVVYASTIWSNDRNHIAVLCRIRLPSVRPDVTLSFEHERFEWCDFGSLTHRFDHPHYQNGFAYGSGHGLLP